MEEEGGGKRKGEIRPQRSLNVFPTGMKQARKKKEEKKGFADIRSFTIFVLREPGERKEKIKRAGKRDCRDPEKKSLREERS